jgi:dUTP pyrophosphatase
MDLYAATNYQVEIRPHETVMIDTGVAIEIPEGYFGGIYARSGLASKKGLRPANCTGVIDADYRDSIKVALHNDTTTIQRIDAGDRIAQLIIQPFESVEFNIVDELTSTDRNLGGFGSTGA